MKIALAQINCIVGDIAGNADKIIDYANRAHAAGASLIITPELALCGYPPEDLLFRDDFNVACERALQKIAHSLPNITLLIGHPKQENGSLFNAASILENGKITATYHKQCLPNYSVFDEERYFEAGNTPLVFEHSGTKIGVMICADGWNPTQPSVPNKLAQRFYYHSTHHLTTWINCKLATKYLQSA